MFIENIKVKSENGGKAIIYSNMWQGVLYVKMHFLLLSLNHLFYKSTIFWDVNVGSYAGVPYTRQCRALAALASLAHFYSLFITLKIALKPI